MLNNKSLILLSALVVVNYANTIFIRNINAVPRIVNGKPVVRGQFPFYALVRPITNGSSEFCGGTLINNQWILTDGHCVGLVEQIDRFEIHLGVLNRTDLNEEGRVVVTAKQSFRHPKFDFWTIYGDIALLKLEEPIQFTAHIQAVNLIQNATLETGTRVTAIGFGRQNRTGPISSTLQFAELFHISHVECVKTFGFLDFRDDVICARAERNETSCDGEVGGPLVSYVNGVPTLIGSTSFGHSAGCRQSQPTGFASISRYLTWIQRTIASN